MVLACDIKEWNGVNYDEDRRDGIVPCWWGMRLKIKSGRKNGKSLSLGRVKIHGGKFSVGWTLVVNNVVGIVDFVDVLMV